MTIPGNALSRAALLSVLGLLSCGPQGGDTAKGQVSIVLASSAAPAALLADDTDTDTDTDGDGHCGGLRAASVTFSAILARTLDGQLVDVGISPATVDLLALVSGKQATLPDGALPPGTYDQLVVVMRNVDLTLADGTGITITPPGGGWTAIVRVAAPFTVTAGATTTVDLVFRAERSFGCGGGRWQFHPDFECRGRR